MFSGLIFPAWHQQRTAARALLGLTRQAVRRASHLSSFSTGSYSSRSVVLPVFAFLVPLYAPHEKPVEMYLICTKAQTKVPKKLFFVRLNLLPPPLSHHSAALLLQYGQPAHQFAQAGMMYGQMGMYPQGYMQQQGMAMPQVREGGKGT